VSVVVFICAAFVQRTFIHVVMNSPENFSLTGNTALTLFSVLGTGVAIESADADGGGHDEWVLKSKGN